MTLQQNKVFILPSDHIPIISRKEANKKLPDYFIILAPNYSDVIIEKESEFIKKGGKFIIPKNEIRNCLKIKKFKIFFP